MLHSTRSKYEHLYSAYCDGLREKNLLRTLTSTKKLDKDSIDFSSSDHLGLRNHPEVIAKSKECLETYGAGSGGSRLLAGNLPIFEELEQRIADTKGVEASVLFNSAYQANASIIPALLNKTITNPIVFADRLVHSSMHVGFAIAGADQIRYRHLDMNHLEELLKANDSAGDRFIFSETTFGMDGDVVDLEGIKFLANKYDAFLYLDEVHSLGLSGKGGYGISLENGISIGAFSKTLGSCGGFASCSKALKTYLINTCKGFIYSTALPPAVIGANLAAWSLLPELDDKRTMITKTSHLLRETLRSNNFDIGSSSTNIIPIIIGSEKATLSLADYLKHNGILASAIRPPSIPPNTSRLRLAIGAHHSPDDIERLVELLISYRDNSGGHSRQPIPTRHCEGAKRPRQSVRGYDKQIAALRSQ